MSRKTIEGTERVDVDHVIGPAEQAPETFLVPEPAAQTSAPERRGNTIIESIGVYFPPKVVSSKEVLKACSHKLLYPLERLTGIKFRRMAGETEFSIDLAKKAVASCLERSKYRAEDIELIVCCNISRYDGPNFQFSFEPSTSAKLREHFGFTNALCFDVSNACAGMFTGVSVADGFIKSGLVRNALVLSGEYITHLTVTAQKEILGIKDDRVPCLTLGDSGAAVILEEGDDRHGFHELELYTLGRYSDCCIARPTYNEHGGAIMFTDSLRIHAVAIKNSVMHIVQTLKKLNWSREAINHVIMHQTARTAISELARQVNALIRDEICNHVTMINNLAERGNTSSTTHFVAIWDNMLNQRIHSQESVVFAVQASGITIGTCPYTFDDLPERLHRQEEHGERPEKIAGLPPNPRTKLEQPRIRFESIGLVPDKEVVHNSIKLATIAGADCLSRSRYEPNDIDLLLNAGVHRNEFICEPAIAAIIAGELRINDDAGEPDARRTFAYDIFNGSIGFLNACYNAIAAIKGGRAETAMVCASEIENNAEKFPDKLLNIRETGSAVILDTDPDLSSGFGSFVFRYFTTYIDKFVSNIGQQRGVNYLNFEKDPELDALFIDCIPQVVQEVLDKEGLELEQIKVILPPQISSPWIRRLADKLQVEPERCVDLAAEGRDYYTSSTPYAMRHAQDQGMVKEGDVGLIINVGSGIQVGCAIYYF